MLTETLPSADILKQITGAETQTKIPEEEAPHQKVLKFSALQSHAQDLEEDSMINCDNNEVGHLDMTWRPQRLLGVCKNPDGIQAVTAFVITSSGTADAEEVGVDVALIEGGTILVISEELCPLIEDPDEFCSLHKKTSDMTEDEHFQRRSQRKQAVTDLFPDGQGTRREFRINPPFKAEPSSLKWQCVGTRTGHRLCPIDMLEKMKAQEKCVLVVGNVKSKSIHKKTKAPFKCSHC